MSGLIRPSAAGPLLEEEDKEPVKLRFATVTTFLACLCPPVTLPHPEPAP